MLAKCANPSCSTPLIYLREGKIFIIENHLQSQAQPDGPSASQPAARVEHFWLCGPCSTEMTITYDGSGVAVVPKARVHGAAA